MIYAPPARPFPWKIPDNPGKTSCGGRGATIFGASPAGGARRARDPARMRAGGRGAWGPSASGPALVLASGAAGAAAQGVWEVFFVF